MASPSRAHLLILLVALSAVATASAARLLASKPPAPTTAQIKAEVMNAARNITAKFPDYSKFATMMKQAVSLKGYNISALGDATVLAPNNAAIDALLKKVPVTQANLPKAYNITAYHVLLKRQPVSTLKAAPVKAFATMLKQGNWKQTAANAATVAFGPKGAAAASWATVKSNGIYVGPYFVVHGVNNYLVPPGTKV
eukprot:TRINITY_DN8651_c0_g1_i2.p1 TRINITY_DN8651_c0_g1~~TRINITY_DN8651_c0_g1_i2.p1  ORF type:complete len:197 (-),score=24.82 TRINITY_DN8651_c0_g1_i2:518-1108(-)